MVRADVRGPVRFRQGNLLAGDFPFAAERYDAIFCRNLLIYFDRPTQDRAIQVLRSLLAPQGVLFVGSSETGLLLDHGWAPVRPRAFAFRMRPAAQTVSGRPRAGTTPAPLRPKPKPAVRAASQERGAPAPRPSADVRRASAPVKLAPLAAAVELADRGNFAEAARLCEQHLRVHGPAAQAYYLLGLVREAAGASQEAEGFYRKTLYLEPNHEEALAHLSLLKAGQGDEATARRLRERLQRLQAQKERP